MFPVFFSFSVAFSTLACYNDAMKKQNEPKTAKIFPYQFTKLMLTLGILVILLCLAGIGVSVYRIYAYGIREFLDVLQSPFLIGVCVLCIVVVSAMLIKSQYVIDETHYTTQFGLIKSKYLIKDVTALEWNAATKKLTVFVGEEFSVLSLNERWQDEFIAALREVKPEIEFTYTSEE